MESNTNNNLNYQMNRFYQKILEIFKKEDQNPSLIYHLIESLEGTIQWCAGYAKTDYEKEVIRNCEIDAIKYYQKSLEYNYEKIKQYKENQDESDKYFMFLTMTFDKEGNPRKVKVIDVIKGKPIFEDGCTLVEIWREINKVSGYKTKLAKWIDKNATLKETLNEALILQQQGKLGSTSVPSPNYDTQGMSRERSDAQAWENYLIETGRYQTTNYDNCLDELIKELKKCIDFFDKSTSIF